MIVTAVCHRDTVQAVRMWNWIAFLARQNARKLSEKVLLVSSVSASPRIAEVATAANMAAESVDVLILKKQDERGWPASPNFMFREALFYVEQHHPGEWVFWLEPDSVPLVPDWFEVLKAERDAAMAGGKEFCGGYVRHHHDHMTGVAWYGPRWRKVAPLLAKADTDAWDTYAHKQTVPNAHFTSLIQHVFKGAPVRDLAVISPKAVLYHQDKRGGLIKLLDAERFGGQFALMFDDPVHKNVMRYYHTTNTRRRIEALGMVFSFENYRFFAGSAYGVYATNDPSEQTALQLLVDDPASAITEITESDYMAKLKKKPSDKAFLQVQPLFTQPTQQVPQVVESPAGVVVDAVAPAEVQVARTVPSLEAAASIEDLLTVGKVESVSTVVPGNPRKRKGGGR